LASDYSFANNDQHQRLRQKFNESQIEDKINAVFKGGVYP